ncbi:2104_t:CDS:1, partial [Racocetra persica]
SNSIQSHILQDLDIVYEENSRLTKQINIEEKNNDIKPKVESQHC